MPRADDGDATTRTDTHERDAKAPTASALGTSRRVLSVESAYHPTNHNTFRGHDMQRLTYTVSETAVILGISRTSAYECVHRGEIASVALGRRLLIPHTAIDKLIGEHPDNNTE